MLFHLWFLPSSISLTACCCSCPAGDGAVSQDDMEIVLRQLAGSSLSDDELHSIIRKVPGPQLGANAARQPRFVFLPVFRLQMCTPSWRAGPAGGSRCGAWPHVPRVPGSAGGSWGGPPCGCAGGGLSAPTQLALIFTTLLCVDTQFLPSVQYCVFAISHQKCLALPA